MSTTAKKLTCDKCGSACAIDLNEAKDKGTPRCLVCGWIGEPSPFAIMRIEYEPIVEKEGD